MKELLTSLDWNKVIVTIWTVVLLPILTYIGKEINEFAKAKKIDKYTDILQNATVQAVKDVYETVVKQIKGTDEWTDEKKQEVKEEAKRKAVFSLSNAAYECLKMANEDFEEYLDSLIESALFDLKNK